MFLHISNGDPKDTLSEQSFDKSSNVEAGKKTPHSVFSDKARAGRERFLPTPQQDKRYTHVHQKVLKNPEIATGRGASHASYDKSRSVRTRSSGYSGPKSSSGARILKEQSNIQPKPRNRSDVPAYNPSGAPSRQPLQTGATKEPTFFNERQHGDEEDIGYKGRLHAKSAITPRMYAYEENPAMTKMRSSQRGLDNSRAADMQRKHVVPKFGDWVSGERFTTVFNKVRIEKSTEYSGPKSSLGARIFQEQSNIQPEPRNWSAVPAYNPFGASSRQPLQSGATKETTFFNERQHDDQEVIGYQGRLHTKSANTPGRYMFEEKPAMAKVRSSQPGLDNSRAADMQRKHVVPKFGDWDSRERFTIIFNKVRVQRSTKHSLNPSSAIAVSPLRADEDLYEDSGTLEGSAEGSTERKKQRWPKRSTVPKFGNWDKSEDLSYSIIFDKARAEKEMFLHISSDGDPKDTLSEQSFDKSSNVEAGKKTRHSVFPDKVRADRERFLPPPQQDKRYTHAHQKVLQNPEIVAGRGDSHASYDKSRGLRTRSSGYSGPKSSSGAQILQEHQNSSNIQPEPQNRFDVPAYNSSFPSGAPSRQPLQSGPTKQTTLFNERQHVDQEDIGYQGRLHAKSAITPAMYAYKENPVMAKTRSSQRGLDNSRTADMQRKHVVPKFGDWDSGERFTTVFSKVRIEKNTKYSLNPSATAASPLRVDQDLYKISGTSEGSTEGSAERKKHRGWFQIICCTAETSPHSVAQ